MFYGLLGFQLTSKSGTIPSTESLSYNRNCFPSLHSHFLPHLQLNILELLYGSNIKGPVTKPEGLITSTSEKCLRKLHLSSTILPLHSPSAFLLPPKNMHTKMHPILIQTRRRSIVKRVLKTLNLLTICCVSLVQIIFL